MDACRTLREYAMYVEQVRHYAKQMPSADAVEKAVNYCIEAGILSDFLMKNRAEVIMLSIFEYDEEAHHKLLYKEGHETGFAEGEKHLAKLLQSLMDAGRSKDISRAISDPVYRKQLYHENGLDVSN